MSKYPVATDCVLVYTPFGKDAQYLGRILATHNVACEACRSVAELIVKISPEVTAILTTEELFVSKELTALTEVLKMQPSWSAIPILIFYTPRPGNEMAQSKTFESFREMADVTFLPRPVSSLVLLSAVQAALRDRRRQYRLRDLLEQLQRDIDRRASQEEELKRAHAAAEEARRAAELANQAKTHFLANMSHEIRTPLGAIMGFADLIAHPEAEHEDREQYIGVIRRNSTQVLRIIDDILDLSKVESGLMVLESISFPLRDLFRDFESTMSLRARENGITLEVRGVADLPAIVQSDPTRLKQILMNVVGNAIKFTKRGGIQVDTTFQDGLLSCRVKDTGCGIDPDQAQNLFQSFVQADASITRKFGGTGLGLILTRRLCEAMGGSFDLIESEVGKAVLFLRP